MGISKYSDLIFENMKNNFSYRLQELELKGELEINLFKREREILEKSKILKEKFENKYPKPETNEIYVVSKYYEMIDGMVEENLIEEVKKQI